MLYSHIVFFCLLYKQLSYVAFLRRHFRICYVTRVEGLNSALSVFPLFIYHLLMSFFLFCFISLLLLKFIFNPYKVYYGDNHAS